MSRRVAVVGAGAMSCLGTDYRQQWREVLAARTGLRRRGDFDPPALAYFGNVKHTDNHLGPGDLKQFKRLTRPSQLGVMTADLAVADAGAVFHAAAPRRRAIYIGSNETEEEKAYFDRYSAVLASARRPDGSIDYARLGQQALRRARPDFLLSGLPNAALCQITIRNSICGANTTLVDSAAIGLCAVGRAFRSIREGRADVAVCGGTDSSRDQFVQLAFRELGLASSCVQGAQSFRPYDRNRDGYICAEGAAVLVLADLKFARANNAEVIAEVLGFGAATDVGHPLAPDPAGSGVRAAITRALADAHLDAARVGYVYGHGDATPGGDRSELCGIADTLARDRRIPLTATKAGTGHIGPATDVLEVIFGCLSVRDRVIPPTLNLVDPDDSAHNVEIVADEPRDLNAQYAIALSRNGNGPEVAALVVGAM